MEFGKNTHDSIITEFKSNVGLLEKIFGDKGVVLHNLEKEKIKKILFEVYGLEDVYDIFDYELDEAKLDRVLKTVFRYSNVRNPDDDPEQMLY